MDISDVICVCEKMTSALFKNEKTCLENIFLIYMYENDLALNDLQWLICRKTKSNQTKV